jgi:cell division initiation protein
MVITPLDIKKKTFSPQVRGVSKSEVQEFMQLVAAEMEELRKERALLAEKVVELSGRIESYETTEQLLKDTLVTAQKATGQLREDAKKEAELVVGKAKVDAERIQLDAGQRVREITDELRTLEMKRTNLADEIASIARTYLAMAERINDRKTSAEATDRAKRTGDTG